MSDAILSESAADNDRIESTGAVARRSAGAIRRGGSGDDISGDAGPGGVDSTGEAVVQPGALSRFWLRRLFGISARAPWLMRALRPLATWITIQSSEPIRRGTRLNLQRILGRPVSRDEAMRFARRVVDNFQDFVIDLAAAPHVTLAQLRQRVTAIENKESYAALRAKGGGAIILTAHLGSFESGLAALRDIEPHVHVVFKRDAMGGFESLRRIHRKTLGVIEAPIDEGWSTWLALRDALRDNHVIVMQGDRAMPGQKFAAAPILGGRIALPLGPFKLAQISGSPIIPIFSLRAGRGKCRIVAEEAIWAHDPAAPARNGGVDGPLLRWAKLLEKYIAAHSDQWLMLEPAFIEDGAMSGVESGA
jgi:lauroyl/myristoyl acyltransferase